MIPLFLEPMETPLGTLWLLATGRGVCSVRFAKAGRRGVAEIPASPSRKELVMGGPVLRRAARQIREYLRQERTSLTVRVDLTGLSAFEKAVLRAVRGVPFGETRTYAELAAMIRQPGAILRVQRFLSENPLPILVPCHRIVGTRGLGPYVGGRRIKARLIGMEEGQTELPLGG